jgi:hypothetical protein
MIQSTNRDTRTEAPRTPLSSQLLYVIVFGYPTDRYSATVEYFRSLGENPTEADPHADIVNCFRIGYRNPVEAVRAIRKNGEILSGTWMVGAKWAVSLLIVVDSHNADSYHRMQFKPKVFSVRQTRTQVFLVLHQHHRLALVFQAM